MSRGQNLVNRRMGRGRCMRRRECINPQEESSTQRAGRGYGRGNGRARCLFEK